MKKRKIAGAVNRSAGAGMVIYRTMLASDFCEMLAGDLIDLQHEHLHIFRPKILGCCIFVVPLKMHV